MNGDDLKPGSNAVPSEGGWEAQVTARLLGELSETESKALDRAMAGDPELARLEDRLRQTVSHVREAAAEPVEPAPGATGLPRMSQGRREKLLEKLRVGHVPSGEASDGPAKAPEASTKTVIPVEFPGGDAPTAQPMGGSWLTLAACLVGLLLSAVFLMEGTLKFPARISKVSILSIRTLVESDSPSLGGNAPLASSLTAPGASTSPRGGVAVFNDTRARGEGVPGGPATDPDPFRMSPELMRRYGLLAGNSGPAAPPSVPDAAEQSIQLERALDRAQPATTPAVPKSQDAPPGPQDGKSAQWMFRVNDFGVVPEAPAVGAKPPTPAFALPPQSPAPAPAPAALPQGALWNKASSSAGVTAFAVSIAPTKGRLAGSGGSGSGGAGDVTVDESRRTMTDPGSVNFRRFGQNAMPGAVGNRHATFFVNGAVRAANEPLSQTRGVVGLGTNRPAVEWEKKLAEAELGQVLARESKDKLSDLSSATPLPAVKARLSEADDVVFGDVPVLGKTFAKRIEDSSGVPAAGGIPAGAKLDALGLDVAEVVQSEAEPANKATEQESVRVLTMEPLVDTGTALESAKRKMAGPPEPAALRPAEPSAPVPQPEVASAENSVSTFSLNVSDVSFKLAGASLDNGQLPGPSTIRTEEFLNAFHYRDPDPSPGRPVAFAWERAQYPFAQQRDVMRFSVRTGASGREVGRPLNLVLLLDSSGSMERADRVATIREALKVLGRQLQEADKVSVVTFARTARLWFDGLPGNQASEMANRMGELVPEGGTHLEEALKVGYETALKHFAPEGVNRLVLLTDGAANLGELRADALKQVVESNRKRGVALDCFGIGFDGYQDELLEALSRNGDGRYGFVNSPEEAATGFANQLAGALHVAASDVKVQVEFNSQRVNAWRQIGYARHQLTQEQFRDNMVDAAEIGAAESGNALYVIEPNARGNGPIGTVRVRYRDPASGLYAEHEWAVPYEGAAAPLEQASPALRLATAAAAFGEMLSMSPYASEVTNDRLIALMNGVPENFQPDPRPERLVQMVRQAQSILGR